jgi:hypothetical protein
MEDEHYLHRIMIYTHSRQFVFGYYLKDLLCPPRRIAKLIFLYTIRPRYLAFLSCFPFLEDSTALFPTGQSLNKHYACDQGVIEYVIQHAGQSNCAL